MAVLIRRSLHNYEIIFYCNPDGHRNSPSVDSNIVSEEDFSKDLYVDDNGRDYSFEAGCRAYRRLVELGTCNHWNFFFTQTINSTLRSRYNNFEDTTKSLLKWFDNYRQRMDASFRYLLVAELHEDGAIHYHGLIYADNIDLRYLNKDARTGCSVYRNMSLFNKFGANRWVKIDKDSEKVTYYISKYIDKNINRIVSENAHRYYASRGLEGYDVRRGDNRIPTMQAWYAFRDLIKKYNKYITVNKYTQKFVLDTSLISFEELELILNDLSATYSRRLPKYGRVTDLERLSGYINPFVEVVQQFFNI